MGNALTGPWIVPSHSRVPISPRKWCIIYGVVIYSYALIMPLNGHTIQSCTIVRRHKTLEASALELSSRPPYSNYALSSQSNHTEKFVRASWVNDATIQPASCHHKPQFSTIFHPDKKEALNSWHLLKRSRFVFYHFVLQLSSLESNWVCWYAIDCALQASAIVSAELARAKVTASLVAEFSFFPRAHSFLSQKPIVNFTPRTDCDLRHPSPPYVVKVSSHISIHIMQSVET